jgi:arylsulfate sulfotransferase
MTAAPSSVALQSGGSARSFTVTTTAVNGFNSAVTVTLSGLPSGVTATPSTLSVTPGQLGQFTLAASTAAGTTSGATITATGTSASLSHTATATLSIAPAVVPDFTITAAPSTISLPSGGSARSLSVTAGALNGFSDPVTVSLSGLPTGVTATPSTLSLSPGQLGQFSLAASASAPTISGATLTVTGSADSLSHTATTSLSIAPAMSNATISATSFDFGNDLVGNTVTKSVVTVTNTGATNVTLSPALSGDPSYSVASASTCGTTLAAGASCSESINYAPTTASGSSPQIATLNLGLGNVPTGTPQTVSLTGVSAVLPQGTVTSTNNPQVALYTMTLPYPGSVTVNFGTDTTYGRQTWSQSTTVPGATISTLVAGMLPNTTYHMQAAVTLLNGATGADIDQTFTSGAPLITPSIAVTTTPGMTPQSGLEELTFVTGSKGIAVTDLQGNILWTYALPAAISSEDIEGVKMLPNGHFLITVGEGSTFSFSSPTEPAGDIVAIREIDLAGNIIREISVNDLSDELQAAGYNLTLQQFHHDVTPLPNGHWLVLSNVLQSYPAGTFTDYPGVTSVLGDVIIDLDQNLQPVWVWNEFDHLDVFRHPYMFPDWTHTNAVVYSPSDHNIIVSMRHQNWVVKVDYEDGQGSGNILWHLGYQGDFTLVGGTDPTDWQYAQHYPSLFTPNSSGVFSLGVMDNGDDRIFPDGGTCGTGSEPACYTTIPVFQLDEGAMTATLTFHQILPTSLYSFFGGNINLLQNGNIEYDLAGTHDSDIFEVTPTPVDSPNTVWHMHLANSNAYRGFRIPSLYPGVQW